MRAFIDIWKSPNDFSHEMIDCQELIIKDGPKLDIDGDECQLFHVIVADHIFHNVCTIEVI